MNTQRAKDISESAAMAYVTYEGVPIYIQHVNEDKETARIFPIGNPQFEQEVLLSDLQELF
ncbi:H-type small acid-soluble spore protein [Bacillus velezensis]